MKMVKSLLLGSAIGIAVVAGAKAADVPCLAKPVTVANIASMTNPGGGTGGITGGGTVLAKQEGSGLIIDGGTVLLREGTGIIDGGTEIITLDRVAFHEGAGLGIMRRFGTEESGTHAWRDIDRVRSKAHSPAPHRADFNTLRRQYM